MKGRAYHEPTATRSLNIELWHELGKMGSPIPVTIPLAGDSMRPLIRRGLDRVTIVPLNRPLKIGDVVLFCGGEKRYVVHRVWKMQNGTVQTLGDNCVNPDPVMPLERIWGLVVRVERGGRTFRLDTSAARAWGRLWMALFPARKLYKRERSLTARAVRKIFPKK